MELLSGHEKIITKSGISLNAGTLNRGFAVSATFKMLLKAFVFIKVICLQPFTDPTGCLLHVITEDQAEPIWVASHCSLL
jgi:hypothetical protein